MAQPPLPPGFVPLNEPQRQPQLPPGFVPMADEKPWIGNPLETATAGLRGINQGAVEVLTAPYRVLDWLAEKTTGTGGLPDADKMSGWGPYLNPPEANTKAGEYLQSAGRAVGGSAVPMAGTMIAAARPAGQMAASTVGQIGQNIVQSARANPAQFVGMDVASSAAGGVAQQAAADAGASPVWQTLAGMGGGMVPGIASAYRTASQQPIGSPTAQGIARQRAQQAEQDAAAFERQGVRPFGPAFNQGPVASVGKQLTETAFIGAPLRNNMDETFHDAAAASRRIANDISPNATIEGAGTAMQGGLDRYRTQGFRQLEPGVVQDMGINPVQPVPVPQGGGRAQLARIQASQPGMQQMTGGTVQNSRGNPAPLPQTRAQRMTARTGVEDLSDAELATVIRTSSDTTSFAARQEALYERAWRGLPPMMRSNGTRDPMLLPTANSGAVARQIAEDEARTGVRAGLQGRYGEMFTTLASPNANVPLATLRSMRTAIGRDLSNFGTYEASLSRSQLRQLYGGISSDIEVGLQDIAARAIQSAQAGGNNGISRQQAVRAVQSLRDFQTADRYFRQGTERMDRFLRVVNAENPQAAAANLIRSATDGVRGNMRMVRAALAPLRPEERSQVGAMIVRQLGAPTDGARGLVQEAQFSPSRFTTNYTALSPEVRQMLFTPAHQAALDDLFRVANRISNVEALANTSRSGTNAINISGAGAAIGSLATGNVGTALMIGGSGYAASIMMSLPQYTRWMTGYLRLRAAVSDGSSAAVAPLARHVMGLERDARYHPELWPVYMAIAAENGIDGGSHGKPN